MSNIPFYAQPDSTSCYQACLKMILGALQPEKHYSWEELYTFCDKKPDKWTWPLRALINLSDTGFEVVNIESFDYDKFIIDPGVYMEEVFGKEMAESQVKHSDISAEVENAKTFVKTISTINRIPDVNDLKDLLDQDYKLLINVNVRVLRDKEGYAGHFIILKYINDEKVIINDPDGDNGENNGYPLEKFLKAWSYPDEKARNIMGVRRKR